MIPTPDQITRMTQFGIRLQAAYDALAAAQDQLDEETETPVVADEFFDGALSVWVTVAGSALQEALSTYATVLSSAIAEKANEEARAILEAGHRQVHRVMTGQAFAPASDSPEIRETQAACPGDCDTCKE